MEVTLGVLNRISPNAVHRPELFRFVLIEQILVPRLLSAVNTDLKHFFKQLCEKLVQPRFRCFHYSTATCNFKGTCLYFMDAF